MGVQRKRDLAPSIAFTPQEGTLVIELKEGKNSLTWPAIHRQFSQPFPGGADPKGTSKYTIARS